MRAGLDGIVANKRELNRERHYVVEKDDDDNAVKNPFSEENCWRRFLRKTENRVQAGVHEIVETVLNKLNPNEKRAAKILVSLVDDTNFLDGFPEQKLPKATRICTGHTHDGYMGLTIPFKLIAENWLHKQENIVFDNTGTGVSVGRLHSIKYVMNNERVISAEQIETDKIIGRKEQENCVNLTSNYKAAACIR